MDAKNCNIDVCDLVTVSKDIVDNYTYDINCGEIDLCGFSKYYFSEKKKNPPSHIFIGKVSKSVIFINHICHVIIEFIIFAKFKNHICELLDGGSSCIIKFKNYICNLKIVSPCVLQINIISPPVPIPTTTTTSTTSTTTTIAPTTTTTTSTTTTSTTTSTTTTIAPTTTTTSTTTTTTTLSPIIVPDCINIPDELGTAYTGIFKPNLAFYRNYEADNSLALGEYTGRIKPIQTPISFVEGTSTYVILENVPLIPDLYTNPARFGLYNISVLTYPDNNLSGITSAENLGTYLGRTNCVKFFTITPALGNISDRYGIYNIFPIGLWRNTNKIVQLVGGTWTSGFVVGATGIWKKQDNTYAMLVTGYNSTGMPTKVKQHLFYSNSLAGPWLDQNTSTESIFTSDYLPPGYIGANSVIGSVDIGNGTHAGSTSLINTSGAMLYPSIVMWNDDLVRRGGFNIIHDYTFSLTFTAYTSLVFYKGKYYYSLQDGTHNTGKRQVLVSNCLEGTYSYHSTILNHADTQFNIQDGLMYHGSFASGRLFTIANRLYFASSGENGNNFLAGEYSNHCIYIWIYDDVLNTWSYLVGPIVTAPHSNSLFGFNWGTDHTGYMDGLYIEDNKLWFNYTLITLQDQYELTNGYFDLSVVLRPV